MLNIVQRITYVISREFRRTRIGKIALLIVAVRHLMGQALDHRRCTAVFRIPGQATVKLQALDQHPIRMQLKRSQLDLSAQCRVVNKHLGLDDDEFPNLVQDERLDNGARLHRPSGQGPGATEKDRQHKQRQTTAEQGGGSHGRP